MDAAWQDPAFAAAWERTVHAGNPTRAEQVDILLRILEATDELVAWLRRAGPCAACVHLHLHRALVVGVRPAG